MTHQRALHSRFECLCVLDLAHLTTSQLSRRALAIIKEQSAIDSVCFPETMAKMLLLNAPTFFSATWLLIKGWLDPRTQAKIEVISSRAAGEKRLLELVDADQLPSDYGGTAQDTQTTLSESSGGAEKRLSTKMLYLRGHSSETFDVPAGMVAQVSVITRSTTAAQFILTGADSKEPLHGPVKVVHPNENVTAPTHHVLNPDNKIKGPIKLKVKADSSGSRFSTSNFLLASALFDE